MRFRQVQFCIGFLLLLASVAIALAQNATGSITGTVTDPNNEAIANATITVTNKATGAVRKVTTRSGGAYSVENLLPGEYEVKVEAQGFVTQLQALPVRRSAAWSTETGSRTFPLTAGVFSQSRRSNLA
jgi:hypothetical protein